MCIRNVHRCLFKTCESYKSDSQESCFNPTFIHVETLWCPKNVPISFQLTTAQSICQDHSREGSQFDRYSTSIKRGCYLLYSTLETINLNFNSNLFDLFVFCLCLEVFIFVLQPCKSFKINVISKMLHENVCISNLKPESAHSSFW